MKKLFIKLSVPYQIIILVLAFILMFVLMFDVPILSVLGFGDFLTYNYIFFLINIFVIVFSSFPFIYLSILFCEQHFTKEGNKKGKLGYVLYFLTAFCLLMLFTIVFTLLLS